jgi:hypothetical protein
MLQTICFFAKILHFLPTFFRKSAFLPLKYSLYERLVAVNQYSKLTAEKFLHISDFSSFKLNMQ